MLMPPTLLAATAGLMPAGVDFEIADCIGDLPHFNPDIDAAANPVTAAWIKQMPISRSLL